MAVAPKLPNLDPADMAWARWVTNRVTGHDTAIAQHSTQILAANQQQSSSSSQTATNTQNQNDPGHQPTPPANGGTVLSPQKPTAPTLNTDHASVTVRWDGLMRNNDGSLPPNASFDHIVVQRSADSGATWVNIGVNQRIAGTTVDTNLVVANVYYYRFIAYNIAGTAGFPSDSAYITVRGVDLGSLDSDVTQTLSDIKHSATTGGLITYSPTPPTDPAYQASNALWFDTSDPSGAVAKRWDSTTNSWVAVPYGEGALGPGSVVASNIVAGAIDTYHLGADIVTADKIEAGAITAEKLEANSVTANAIAAGSVDTNQLAAGAITADKIDLGAVPTESTNRVPQPPTNQAWWQNAITNYAPNDSTGLNNWTHHDESVTATAAGLFFRSTTTSRAILGLTPQLAVPQSNKIVITWQASDQIGVCVRANVNGTPQWHQYIATGVSGSIDYTIDDSADTYGVYFMCEKGYTPTLQSVQVFEVIGTGSAQHSELSPDGLRLFNDAGDLVVDLSSNNDNYFTIYNDGQAESTIDENGSATFQDVAVSDDININGDDLVDDFADWTRMDGALDGGLLNRVPKGIVYAATWDSMDGTAVNVQYQRIATGTFQLDPDRHYMIAVDLGGLQTHNNTATNIYAELQLKSSAFTSVSDGTITQRSNTYSGESDTFNLNPSFFYTTATSGFDVGNGFLPSNTDIFWQLDMNMSSAPNTPYTLLQPSTRRGLTIIDLGQAMVPVDATDTSTSGGQSTSSGSATQGSKSKTKTWTASWSASWHDGGGTKVSGSGTYTDGDMLYQGLGVTSMGAKVGFDSSVASTLSGKTIKKVELYLQNRWTYNSSGATAHLAGHANSSAPSTFGSTVSGTGFTEDFNRSQGKWFTISNSDIPYSSWKSGAVKGIALTIQGTDAAYQYYDGANKSKPPKLRITYSN